MRLVEKLKNRWCDIDRPFLIGPAGELRFKDISEQTPVDLSAVKSGDVVALIGDFDPQSILTLLILIDMDVILVPLTKETQAQHEYFFKSALVDFVVEGNKIKSIKHDLQNEFIHSLRLKKHAGLILFSSGTTGSPKAILHDLTIFMRRFDTPRPALRTLSFLLFDHIGGLNTLFHTLFNTGTIIAPKSRKVTDILATCSKHGVEVMPTTPTFLRMLLMSGLVPGAVPSSLKIITYGTERMDEPTLDMLCMLLPSIDFRQTFGMSELGIVRVKSEARNSLYMKIGGEGVETRVVDGVLEIRSEARMIGYLNAASPFDDDGWYNTADVVEQRGGYFLIVGRSNEVINVGGLKFMASEVERIALAYENVELAKAEPKTNPITGQHVELTVQPVLGSDIDKKGLKALLNKNLPSHMIPRRIKVATVNVGHRLKRL